MTLDDYRVLFRKKLAALYNPSEADAIIYLALSHVLGMNKVEVALSRKRTLTRSEIKALDSVQARLQEAEPIQYIIGSTGFYGLEFEVNRSTLIPRPETEELVAWILSTVKSTNASLQVLDIGTGSGCIAITLANNLPNAQVEAIDVSLQAIETASGNAQNNQTQVQFYQQDILEATDLPKKYDVIVSNPPYVRVLEKAEIQSNVLKHEPHQALFVSDDDPLIFYRKIATLAVDNLAPEGQLFFEINEYLGDETITLLKSLGFSQVELRKDLFGKDRMIRAQV